MCSRSRASSGGATSIESASYHRAATPVIAAALHPPDESGPAKLHLLSLRRLNRIRSVDADNDSLTAEAGCVLASVQQAADAAERFFPLSLGSEGSCQIGGNLATNAGGLNVVRYGMARDLLLGIEAVLPDGQVFDGF